MLAYVAIYKALSKTYRTTFTFKEELKKEMKQEIMSFRQEIDRKLVENKTELQQHKVTISESQTRIAELEEWNTDAGEMLAALEKLTQRLEEKITDLEGRSHRNNIHIFGLPKDTENGDMVKFINHLLTTELQLEEEIKLQIQRAHRAIGRKPLPGANP